MKFWSRKWKSSKQPRKQRKYRYNAPDHVRHKLLSAHLSKELRSKYNKRSFPLRKGDTVSIMKGDFKDKSEKINRVSLRKYKIYIEGVTRKKVDGSDVQVPIDPSNLLITDLNVEDEKRLKALKRTKGKEEKHGSPKKTIRSKVLETKKKGKEMGSRTKGRSS